MEINVYLKILKNLKNHQKMKLHMCSLVSQIIEVLVYVKSEPDSNMSELNVEIFSLFTINTCTPSYTSIQKSRLENN